MRFKKVGPCQGLTNARWPIKGSDGGEGRAAMSLLASLLSRGLRGRISLHTGVNMKQSNAVQA